MTIVEKQPIRLALIRALATNTDVEFAIEHVTRELKVPEEYVRDVVAECEQQAA